MPLEKHRFIDAPYAWKGAELQHRPTGCGRSARASSRRSTRALQSVKPRGLGLFDICGRLSRCRTFSERSAKITRTRDRARMIMLRGLPLSYSPDDMRTVYWGIGAHLGTAVSQNHTGELLGLVKDFGSVENTKRRGSKTADGLEFHSDRCDVVGLLCVRKAKSGVQAASSARRRSTTKSCAGGRS